jgi:protein DGCR14
VRPGVDATPLITWGEIEGTPLRIDDLDDVASGPTFKLPDRGKRDLLGEELAMKASRNLARRQTPAASGTHKTPGIERYVFVDLRDAGMRI